MAEGTRTRPSRKQDAEANAAAEADSSASEQPADIAKAKAKRRANTPKMELYYEGDDGVLTPMGSFKGREPEAVFESYVADMDDETKSQAYAARDYAVNTPEGLVRLAAEEVHTFSIARR
jgi:hypothetical protein